MSYFVSQNVGGNLHSAVQYINKTGLGMFVFQIDAATINACIVIWKFDDYPTYLHWCKRMKYDPVDTKEFFGDTMS